MTASEQGTSIIATSQKKSGKTDSKKGQQQVKKAAGPKGGSIKQDVISSSTVAGPSASSSSNPKSKRTRKKKERQEKGDAGGSARGGAGAGGGGGGAEDPVGKMKLKVVVRKLPPNVPEAVFWKAVSPWITRPKEMTYNENSTTIVNDDDQAKANVDYAYFVKGKLKDGSRRGISADSGVSPHVSSRAYLRFKTMEALLAFHRGFDGHLFKDAKGNEYIAIVEFAPFQRTPNDFSRRKKRDPRQGTISQDTNYQAFLTSLQQKKAEEGGQTQAEKTDAQLMSQMTSTQANTASNAERAKHTPLLDHLRAQRTAKAQSSALKNARSYLNRSNNAYAAAASSSKAGGSAEKSKGKGRGQAGAAASRDPSIPTGPRASRKAEVSKKDKSAKKQLQNNITKAEGNDAIPKGPSASSKGASRPSKAQGGSGGSAKEQGKSGDAEPKLLTILAKDDGGQNQSQSAMIPTASSIEKGGGGGGGGGAARGSRGRGGRGRGVNGGSGGGRGTGTRSGAA